MSNANNSSKSNTGKTFGRSQSFQPLSDDLTPGLILSGRYELKEKLGQGGMGSVWKAYDQLEEMDYALKFVLRKGGEFGEEKYAADLALAESAYKKIKRLSHPNICIPRTSGEDSQYGYYFVMNLLEGNSLDRMIKGYKERGNRISPSYAMEILEGLASALDYIHAENVLHRDIKPSNIMISRDSSNRIITQLIDFGLASTHHSAGSRVLNVQHGGGTFPYMSPEQKDGDLPDHRSDQFSLGLVAYELLSSGGFPRRPCTPPRIEGVSDGVNAALKRVLSYDPEERYENCQSFIQAIKGEGEKQAEGARIEEKRPVATPRNAPPAAGSLRELKTGGITYRFRYCPAGTFMMGSPEDEEGRWKNELLYEVTLTQGFWLLETPVTQEMWESVMGKNPSEFKGKQLPVEQVTWNDCQAFCKKVTEATGQKIGLPTEAQWEYACRAGATGAYSGTGNLDDMGWYTLNSNWEPHEVGGKKPNAWNLYDMHGNVWEWCQDRYGAYPSGSVTDPTCPEIGSNRVFRGGGWFNGAENCRCAYRNDGAPEHRNNLIGFRLLLSSSQG